MPQFHSLSIADSLTEVKSSPKGLTEKESEERILEFGKNVLAEEKIKHLEIFIRQIKNPIVYILIFSAIISLFLGDIKDFIVIALVILINTLIGFWQELKAEVSTQALRKMTETHMRVLRGDEEKEIPSSDIVPGDIVVLREGDVVGADIRLIESNTLFINESTITGESLPVEKTADKVLPPHTQTFDLENMLLSGTVVVKGTGTGVVTATGRHTYLASIAEKIMEKSPDSPLTKAISRFSKKYIIIIFFALIIIGTVMFLQQQSLSTIVYSLLAITVSAVPEGLPIVLTLSLAVGSLRLAKKSILTRHLPAVETLGSTTLIATDKTGTITKGELIVADEYTNDKVLLQKIAALANESDDGESGDPLDVALAVWMDTEFHVHKKAYQHITLHPFDSTLKYMAATVEEKGKEHTFIKGAFESLLKQSNNTNDEKEKFQKEHDRMASEGLRVITLGTTHSKGEFETWKVEIVGLIGFIDPPKEGVKEAVKAAQHAGVKIIMITGDNPLTAKAIAAKVHIYKEGDLVLTGKEIELLTDEELMEKLESTTVLARIVPEHKYRIVKLLQKKEIVAVTGDGVNDVLALKAADLGIAMGSGTEAAKSTAKMILLDDNLSVIVEAIRLGRVITDNIKKVIYYLVVTNLSQIFIIFSAIVLNLPSPLKPIHILWINLVTDGVQDKTFPFIKEEGNVMKRQPQHTSNLFLNKSQLLNMLAGTIAIALPNLILYYYMLGIFPSDEVNTTIFTSIVVAQWVNGIQAQKQIEPFLKNIRHSIMINPSIWLGVTAGIILQGLVIFVFSEWFSTVPIGVPHFQLIGITTLIVFLLIECKKWILYLFSSENK